MLRAIHLCFTAHLHLSLSPDLLWYAVVHETAVHIRLNSRTYEGVFTGTSEEQQLITVRDDLAALDWERSINLVQQPLRARIGDDVADLFQPAFSTTTPGDATAALVALMDVGTPYYRFQWVSLCGIPRIRLEGSGRDKRPGRLFEHMCLRRDEIRMAERETEHAGCTDRCRARRPLGAILAETPPTPPPPLPRATRTRFPHSGRPPRFDRTDYHESTRSMRH